MIGAFYGALGQLAKKPLHFVPASVAALANIFVLLFSIDNYYSFIYDGIVLENIVGNNALEVIFYTLTTYTIDLVFIALTVFLSGVISIYTLFVYAALSDDEKKPLLGALLAPLSRIGEISGIVFFFFVLGALLFSAGAVLFALMLSEGIVSIIAGILLGALFLFGFYVMAKLIFVPAIMALERMKLKQALGRSWKWSENRLFGILLFMMVLSLITSIISGVFFALEETLNSELIGLVLVVLGTGLSGAFYNLAIIKYYSISVKT